jgi:hypothetical protein
MRRRRALAFDLGVAVIAAVLVVVLSPGLALVGVIALVALILIGLSLFFGWVLSKIRGRSRDRGERPRRRPPRREVQPPRRRPPPRAGL